MMSDIPRKEIIVSGFSEQTTLEDIKIRFSAYGEIRDCHLLSSLNKKKRVYISFFNEENGTRAINDGQKHEVYLHDVKLTVRSQPEDNREKNNKLQFYLENNLGKTSIGELNDDCLFLIFSYFSVTEKLVLREVCTRWCSIADTSLRRVKYLDLIAPRLEEKNQRIHYNRKIYKSLRELEQLKLPVKTSSFYCAEVMKKSPLDLVACLNMQFVAINCRSLTKLIIRATVENEDILSLIFKSNQALQHVELSWNEYIEGESFVYLSEKLDTLMVEGPNLRSDYLCPALKRLKHLKCFKIIGCYGYDVLNNINDCCENLESLEFQLWHGSRAFNSLISVTKLKNLKCLKMFNCDILTDRFLVELNKNCQELDHLEIQFCSRIQEIGMRAICSFPKLRTLILNSPFSIDTNNLSNLSELQILALDCQHCSIQEEQIVKIIKNLPKLTFLSIHACMPNIKENIFVESKNISANRSNNTPLEFVIRHTMGRNNIRNRQRYVIYNGKVY